MKYTVLLYVLYCTITLYCLTVCTEMKLQNTQAGMHDLTTRKYQTKQYSELPTAKANQASKPKMTTTLVLSFANT